MAATARIREHDQHVLAHAADAALPNPARYPWVCCLRYARALSASNPHRVSALIRQALHVINHHEIALPEDARDVVVGARGAGLMQQVVTPCLANSLTAFLVS